MDVFDAAARSQIMARVRASGNRSTEERLIKIFRQKNISGWRRKRPLLGKPDFVFPREKIAVFVDGCFWHGCPLHCRMPKTRKNYWRDKISGNIRRDRKVSRKLRAANWRVFRIWEHELGKPILNRKLGKIRKAVGGK